MSLSDLGSGEPVLGAIINTYPKQLRFNEKMDEAYVINYSYIKLPDLLSSLTGTLYLPDQFFMGVKYKLAELLAESMGDTEHAITSRAFYDAWLKKHKAMAASDHLTEYEMRFNNFA